MREDGRHTFAAMSLTRLRDALPIEEQPFYRGVRFDDGNRDSQEIGQARIVDRKKRRAGISSGPSDFSPRSELTRGRGPVRERLKVRTTASGCGGHRPIRARGWS
jgi:hypothetical protein